MTAPARSDDRIIHAEHPVDGRQVVRYDRAGKWFLEYEPRLMRSCRHIGVAEAVRIAVDIAESGGHVYLGRLGGKTFQRQYREAMS